MTLLEWFVAPLQYDFMLRALLVAVVSGGVCAILSCWLTLIGWSLLGDSVSHAVLPGVVISYIIGIPFKIGAFVFGVGAVGLIRGGAPHVAGEGGRGDRGGVHGLFALGIVLVSRTPSDTDLTHILFGNRPATRDPRAGAPVPHRSKVTLLRLRSGHDGEPGAAPRLPPSRR